MNKSHITTRGLLRSRTPVIIMDARAARPWIYSLQQYTVTEHEVGPGTSERLKK